VSGPRLFTRNLLAYLGSRFCAASAMTMLRAGVAWHVFALTGSAFHLGMVGLVQFLPTPAFMLLGGALADTYDRRTIMMTAQSAAMTSALVLGVATWRGAVTLPLLYAIVVAIAIAGTFDSPSRAALLPTLVPREILPHAVTISSTNQALAFTTGPALGGLLIAAAGIRAVYVAYAVLVTGSVLGLLVLRPAPTPRRDGLTVRSTVRAIREGLAFVRGRQVVLGCMVLDMFAVIFGGAAALLPIYADRILQVGPRGYGLLTSSLELGALLSALVMSVRPPIHRGGRALLAAVGVYGTATVVFGLSRWFPLSVAAYMLVGVADQVSVVMRSTIIQLATPDEIRGRVSAVNMIFIGASNQLGAAESGFVAALTSAPFAVVSGGLGCLVVLALVAATMPHLRRYRVG
jgi:MFS family permease